MYYEQVVGLKLIAILSGHLVLQYDLPGNSPSTSGKLTKPAIQGSEPRREPGGSPDQPPGAAGAPGWLIWLPRAWISPDLPRSGETWGDLGFPPGFPDLAAPPGAFGGSPEVPGRRPTGAYSPAPSLRAHCPDLAGAVGGSRQGWVPPTAASSNLNRF